MFIAGWLYRSRAMLCSLAASLFIFSGCGRSGSDADLQRAMADFEIAPGFTIELLVAEPLISDPVDMEIDEYGQLYVVEMPGYPLDISGSGKIKLLTDRDGDGKIETSTTFAEGLTLPNSIMRWKNGVIVTDAPHVLYFEDADNDGHAEVVDTLLTGFALSNPQHNLNSPVLGIDNWIYLAHEGTVTTKTYAEEFGDRGREVHFPARPDGPRLPVNASDRSVRFRPDTYELELLSSTTQFGHTFDEWGNHFLVGNSNHIYHEVIAEQYTGRNKNLPVANATQTISDHGAAAEVFPITLNPQHQLLTDVGVITSACGLTAYLGGAFPPPFDQNVTFVAEPVSNLIHADKITPAGATFNASRLFPDKEFLASKDAKFRPVNMYVGPDGALYVVDYYRQIIEHPEWMGDEVIQSGELYNDTEKGRIYRITATNAPAAEWMKGLTLGDYSTAQLVGMLANPNHWWRHNAQRLLIDRNDKQAVPALNKLCTDSSSPAGRLHALWTLEGMKELQPERIQEALRDPVAGIRENAVRLAELHLEDNPQLVNDLLKLDQDADVKVRYQLLCTLGFVDSPGAAQVRGKLLFQDIQDEWVQVAALSAQSTDAAGLLRNALAAGKDDDPSYRTLIRRLGSMVAASGDVKVVQQFIGNALAATSDKGNSLVLNGIATAWEDTKPSTPLTPAQRNKLIDACFTHPVRDVRGASLRLLRAAASPVDLKPSMPRASTIAADTSQPAEDRAVAIDFLALGDPGPYTSMLKSLIVPREELTVQLAALRALGNIRDNSISSYLLEQWPSLTPELQDVAVGTFLTNADRVAMLLSAVDSGRISATAISWPRQVRLMQHDDDALKYKARALFTKHDDGKIADEYKQALTLTGDAIKGKDVFIKNCALCHQVRGSLGSAVGPDLGTVHNWSAEAIMQNTLSPNLSISSGFDSWSVELQNGETFVGVIASETPAAITIRNAGSFEKTISRQQIKSLKALNMSIMPEGMAAQVSPEEMADLLQFLRN